MCNYEGCTNSTNYQSEQALKKHIKNRHLGIKQHVCDVCEMAFAEKSVRLVFFINYIDRYFTI